MGVAKAPGRLRRYRIDLAAGSLREEILALLSLVDFDIEILHSAHDGVAVAPPKPRIGDQAGGAGSRSVPWRPSLMTVPLQSRPNASPFCNLCLHETAWWGWEDSNLQPNDYQPLCSQHLSASAQVSLNGVIAAGRKRGKPFSPSSVRSIVA
jgi:hypothetical protein